MSLPPLDLRRFAQRTASWLSEPAPESDVVLSSRVRLARNLTEYPFVTRLDAAQAAELAARVQDTLEAARIDGETRWVALADAPPLLRLMLRERHLASRELVPTEDGQKALPGRAVAFGASECVAVMVNEEDHLRLQSIAAGYQIPAAWERVRDLDVFAESRLGFAASPDLGYLTGCPTNVGTGLRASVMLHLPALGLVRSELEKVFTAAQRTGLAVRGLYGEGSRAIGDFYQISNQITLGRSEAQLLGDLQALVPRIVEFERKLRDAFAKEQRAAIQDRVSRSLGLLRTARSMATDAALGHLSNLRLGVYLGIVQEPALEVLSGLAVQVQKAHVQALSADVAIDALLEPSARDALRASFLRKSLAPRAE